MVFIFKISEVNHKKIKETKKYAPGQYNKK